MAKTTLDLIDTALCSPEGGGVNCDVLKTLLRKIVTKLGIEKELPDVDPNQVKIAPAVGQLQKDVGVIKNLFLDHRDNIDRNMDLGGKSSLTQNDRRRLSARDGRGSESYDADYSARSIADLGSQQQSQKKIPQSREELAKMSTAELTQLTPEQALNLSPEALKGMTPEQRKAVNEARKPEKMSFEEASNLSSESKANMTQEQKEAAEKALAKGPPSTKSPSQELAKKTSPSALKAMGKEEVQKLSPDQIASDMSYENAKALPPEVLAKMTPAQREAVAKLIKAGPDGPRPSASKQNQGAPKTTAKGLASMTKEQVQNISPDEIASEMKYEDAKALRPSLLEKMTPAQREAVKKVIEKGTDASASGKPTPAQAAESKTMVNKIAALTKDQVQNISPEEIASSMTAENAKALSPEVLAKMTPAQREAVKKVIDSAPAQKGKKNMKSAMAAMSKDQLQTIPPDQIATEMKYEDAKALRPSLLEKMTPAQREAIAKIVKAGPPKKRTKSGLAAMTPELLQKLSPEELSAELSFADAKALSPSVLEKMTAAQRAAVEKIIQAGPSASRPASKSARPSQPKLVVENMVGMTKEAVQDITPESIAAQMSYKDAIGLPQSVLDKMSPAQRQAIEDIIKGGPRGKSGSGGWKASPYDPCAEAVDAAKQNLAQNPLWWMKNSVRPLHSMTKEEVQDIPVGYIAAEMKYEDAKALPSSIQEKMSPAQKAAVEKILKAGPTACAPSCGLDTVGQLMAMTKEQLQEIPTWMFAVDLKYEDAKALPPAVLENMRPQQRNAVWKILKEGPKPKKPSSGTTLNNNN